MFVLCGQFIAESKLFSNQDGHRSPFYLRLLPPGRSRQKFDAACMLHHVLLELERMDGKHKKSKTFVVLKTRRTTTSYLQDCCFFLTKMSGFPRAERIKQNIEKFLLQRSQCHTRIHCHSIPATNWNEASLSLNKKRTVEDCQYLSMEFTLHRRAKNHR